MSKFFGQLSYVNDSKNISQWNGVQWKVVLFCFGG